MNLWKTALLCALIFTALWLLSPSRSRTASEPGVVEITYMEPTGPIAAPMDDAVRVFEAQSRADHAKDPSKPIYRVISGQNAGSDPSEDPTRFLVSVAGGMPPDVIAFDRFAISQWSARGVFTPLDSYVNADIKAGRADAIHSQDYFPSAWDEAVYTDPVSGSKTLYGVPFNMDSRALFYNKSMLKKAGFVDAHGQALPPRTWEQLEAMEAKLTQTDEDGHIIRLGFVPNYGNSWLYIFGWMNGGEFMSADGKRCTLNDPRIVGALDWMTQQYDNQGGAKAVYAFQSSFQGGELDPFIIGKVAMKIDGVWMLHQMSQYARNLDWGVAPPPIPQDMVTKTHTTLSWVGGWAYAIPSTAKHKDAAWALIRFLASKQAYKIMADSERLTTLSQGQSFVPRQAPNRAINEWLAKTYVYDDPASDPKVAAALRVFNDLIPEARFRPVTEVGQLLWNQQITCMESAIFHKQTAQEALDQGTALVQRELDTDLAPPKGIPVKLSWFVWPYVGLVVLLVLLVYLWETRSGFRGTAARWLAPVGGKKLLERGRGLEGVNGGHLSAQWKDGWFLASPWIIGFIVFTGGPILFSIMMSFCSYDVINNPRLIGLDNYHELFFQDPLFWKSLWNTTYMLVGIPLGMALSLGMSLLLNTKVKGVAVWRTLFYIPSIVPAVAAAILWVWMLNPNSGLLNVVLASVGLHGPNWLQDEQTSKLSLIIMGLWASGGGIIIWLAGLKGISESYYEAAAIDGAGDVDCFVHITLPMLSPYIFFNLIMGLIGTIQIFLPAFIMTQGQPLNSTLFFVYYLFNNAFRYLIMGRAAAMAWFLFLIVFGLTLFQLKMSNRWVHYEGD
jgi:ABC-type sugar transport system permease subunit/ABC-type glycerol-3-phosphate transport system substrate-binding protein